MQFHYYHTITHTIIENLFNKKRFTKKYLLASFKYILSKLRLTPLRIFGLHGFMTNLKHPRSKTHRLCVIIYLQLLYISVMQAKWDWGISTIIST